MWLPRRLEAIVGADRPVLLLGGERHGVPFLLDALRARGRAAWWRLERRAEDDDVAQGNALAEAVNRRLGAPLLPLALPYPAHLRTLRHHAADLRPLWLAVTTESADAALLADLLELHACGFGVVVDLRDGEAPGAPPWCDRCLVLGPERLRLTRDEAVGAAPGALGPERVAAAWRSTGGAFGEFLAQVQALAEMPATPVPGPDGPLEREGRAEGVPPALAVRALQREGALVEALELAVLAVPEAVDELLRSAGPAYQERGLLHRLHLLLTALPEPYARTERTLAWRLLAAVAVGEVAAVVDDVDAHLAAHVAPELRARRAGTLPHAEGYAMAEAAVAARRSPLTLWQAGRMHPDPAAGARLLEESVRRSEEHGLPYDVARAAGSLAARLLHLGEFSQARAWAQWALQVFDQHELRDGARRLLLVNDLAFARLLTGDVAGLRRLLADAEASVSGVRRAVADLLRSTRAAVELAEEDPEAALALLRPAFDASGRARRGVFLPQLVRVLDELGRWDEAARLAEDAIVLAEDAGDHARATTRLARGMARAAAWAAAGGDPADARADAAREDLMSAMVAPELAAELRLPAALHYLLVRPGAAHDLPRDLASVVAGLNPTALRLFSGPARLFHEPVWSTLSGDGAPLRLRFFGAAQARLDGRPVELPPRLAEVALALTLHPGGLTRDQLNDFLTPDGQAPFTSGGLRAVLTRLRGLLPVSDAPYRWAVPFSADVADVARLLGEARARDAVAAWRGPLLPLSDAPGVLEARGALEEELRQVVLQSGDADALVELAHRLGDDLQVWEGAVTALNAGDPRLAVALARVRRLAREYA